MGAAVSRYYLAAAEGVPPPDWVYGALFALIFVFVFWPRK